MAKSHPSGMHICYATFAGISLRLCSISLRSFRITFAAYLPTHIKSLRDFFQSLLNNHRDNLYIISKNLECSCEILGFSLSVTDCSYNLTVLSTTTLYVRFLLPPSGKTILIAISAWRYSLVLDTLLPI